MSVSRRRFLKRAGAGLVTTAGVLALPGSASAASGGRRISGSGSYDLGPFDHRDDPNNPDNKVPLTTDLGFDETMVYCKVTTNFEPFIFPAYNPAFGMVPVDAHSFFMDMQSTRIDRLDIVDGPDGQPRAIYEGVMRSITRANVAGTLYEFDEQEIPYGCVADDDPFGTPAEVGISKNSFSMTGYFDPAGGHHNLFGPEFTFAGTLTSGNIVIEKGVDAQIPVLTLTNTTDPARNMAARVGDEWRLDIMGATPNAPVYIKIWQEVDGVATPWMGGVHGPFGVTDAQGMWSRTGMFTSGLVGTWWEKAIIGGPDSTERSATIRFTVMNP